MTAARECVKTAIAEGAAKLEELTQAVEGAKAETQAAVRGVVVQTRYASRVQSVVRATPPDAFVAAMGAIIDADRAALALRGK